MKSITKEKVKTETKQLTKGWYQLLKWIAMFTMLIDHIAFFLAEPLNWGLNEYLASRMIGRMAYPLFAFLLVESFFYTKNRKKHLGMMFLLAVISEIPFNITANMSFFYKEYQNTIFELIIAYVLLCTYEIDYDEIIRKNVLPDIKWKLAKSEFNIKLTVFSIKCCLTGLALAISEFFCTDYGFSGILLITFFYIAKKSSNNRMLFTVIAIGLFVIIQFSLKGEITEIATIADIFLIGYALINNDKFQRKVSKTEKWICRCFYPAHLILLIVYRLIFL